MIGEAEIAGYFTRFAPELAELGTAARERLRAGLPGLAEIVYWYERQGALVLASSPSGRGHEAIVSLALYPDRACLHFGQGARLAAADPGKLSRGRGKAVRHVVLGAAEDLDRREIRALVEAALRLAGADGWAHGEQRSG